MKRFNRLNTTTAAVVLRRHHSILPSSSSSSSSSSALLISHQNVAAAGMTSPATSGPLLHHHQQRFYAGSFSRKKDKKKKAGEGESAEGQRFDEELWKMRPQWVTLTRTPEQLAEEEELVKSYCRLKMKQEKEDNRDLSKALKLKLAALNELPPDLRSAAMVEEVASPPRERVIPLWTAPIPDYQETLPPEKRDEPFDFTKLGSMRKRP